MATKNIHKGNTIFKTSQILLCIFFLLCVIIGNWGLYHFNNEAQLTEKIWFNILAGFGLGLLINFLTTMFFGETKRKELAETTYDKLNLIADQLLTKSEVRGLTETEYNVLSQLASIMGDLSKNCEVNLDTFNNKLERLKNNATSFVSKITNSNESLYSGVQAYTEVLLRHQHHPTQTNSGSGAPPVNPNP